MGNYHLRYVCTNFFLFFDNSAWKMSQLAWIKLNWKKIIKFFDVLKTALKKTKKGPFRHYFAKIQLKLRKRQQNLKKIMSIIVLLLPHNIIWCSHQNIKMFIMDFRRIDEEKKNETHKLIL